MTRATPLRAAALLAAAFWLAGCGPKLVRQRIYDQPTARVQDLKSARNFVDQALGEISQGKPVSVTASRAYGCSIKYGS